MGGLLRCCLASLDEWAAGPDYHEPTEGDIRACTVGKPCRSTVIFSEGAWGWNMPEELRTRHRRHQEGAC